MSKIWAILRDLENGNRKWLVCLILILFFQNHSPFHTSSSIVLPFCSWGRYNDPVLEWPPVLSPWKWWLHLGSPPGWQSSHRSYLHQGAGSSWRGSGLLTTRQTHRLQDGRLIKHFFNIALAFIPRFCQKSKQLLCNCPASYWTFSFKPANFH